MTKITERAERMAARATGARDLYALLRASSQGLSVAEAAQFLPALHHVMAGTAEGARLAGVDQGLLQAVIRAGAGLEPVAAAVGLRAHLLAQRANPLFQPDFDLASCIALPTTGKRPDMPAFSDRAFDDWFAATGARYGLGLYGEKREVYTSAQFADSMSDERRRVHLGVDVFAAAGTPVHAPLAGEVAFVTYNADPLDYGHTLIVRHDGFFTLYGHLGGTLPGLVQVGQPVQAGQVIAHLGDWHENGGWAAHLHFQIISDMMNQRGGNFWGVGHESLWDVWQEISPDANLLLRLPAHAFQV